VDGDAARVERPNGRASHLAAANDDHRIVVVFIYGKHRVERGDLIHRAHDDGHVLIVENRVRGRREQVALLPITDDRETRELAKLRLPERAPDEPGAVRGELGDVEIAI